MSLISSGVAANRRLTLETVEEYLGNNGLSNLPDVDGEFAKRGCAHKHLASSRCSLATSLVGRAAMYIPCIALGLTGIITNKLGFQTLAKKTFNCAELLSGYSVSDSSLKPLVRTLNRAQKKDFSDHVEGVCAGSSLYFNHIYSSLSKANKNSLMNPKELLIQCANLFVYGGTEEAVHLHKSFGRMVDVSMPFYKGRELLSLVPDNNRSSLKEGMIFYHNQNDLKRLSNGPHIVKVYNSGGYHAMSLIKLSDNECYIFDPAKGLFEFRGEDFPDQIVQFLNKGYRFSHKFNYLQFVRKTGHAEVGASEIKEMYVQILPMQKPKDFRKFQAVDLSRLAERDREACRAYRIGCLGYIWGYFIDSIKASL